MWNFCDCEWLGSTCWLPNWNSAYAFQKNKNCFQYRYIWINAIWPCFLKVLCLLPRPLEKTHMHMHPHRPLNSVLKIWVSFFTLIHPILFFVFPPVKTSKITSSMLSLKMCCLTSCFALLDFCLAVCVIFTCDLIGQLLFWLKILFSRILKDTSLISVCAAV